MSLTKADIQKLASLSRMKLSDEEIDQFTNEIDSILGYVEQIKEVSDTGEKVNILHKNILREDLDDRNLNNTSEELVSSAPASQDNLIKVKKILN